MINENRIEYYYYYYYYPYSVEIVTVSGSDLEECFFFCSFRPRDVKRFGQQSHSYPVVVS